MKLHLQWLNQRSRAATRTTWHPIPSTSRSPPQCTCYPTVPYDNLEIPPVRHHCFVLRLHIKLSEASSRQRPYPTLPTYNTLATRTQYTLILSTDRIHTVVPSSVQHLARWGCSQVPHAKTSRDYALAARPTGLNWLAWRILLICLVLVRVHLHCICSCFCTDSTSLFVFFFLSFFFFHPSLASFQEY